MSRNIYKKLKFLIEGGGSTKSIWKLRFIFIQTAKPNFEALRDFNNMVSETEHTTLL